MSVTIDGTTGISGVAGSASAPALIGTDADSGYYINSANEPSASVNGTAVWNAASTFGFKNRIINGAMAVDQRNAGASITPTTTVYPYQYTVDRWSATISAASKLSFQQQTSVVPPNFTTAMKITSLSAYSVGAADYFLYQQAIEGWNIADLGWGTANAKPVTVSFWVQSSLTGTFGGILQNAGQTRTYPFTYTINSANTWEQKTITVTGDTTGTWKSDNSQGIVLALALGVGSTYSGTAGAWAGTVYLSATGATSLVGTNGATFYITGVQLEKGSTATSFDYRDYGRELIMCQRYYSKSLPTNTAPADGVGSTVETGLTMYNSAAGEVGFAFPVTMRATPTLTFYRSSAGSAAGKWVVYYSGSWNNANTTGGAADATCFYVNIQPATSLTAGNS